MLSSMCYVFMKEQEVCIFFEKHHIIWQWGSLNLYFPCVCSLFHYDSSLKDSFKINAALHLHALHCLVCSLWPSSRGPWPPCRSRSKASCSSQYPCSLQLRCLPHKHNNPCFVITWKSNYFKSRYGSVFQWCCDLSTERPSGHPASAQLVGGRSAPADRPAGLQGAQ